MCEKERGMEQRMERIRYVRKTQRGEEEIKRQERARQERDKQ